MKTFSKVQTTADMTAYICPSCDVCNADSDFYEMAGYSVVSRKCARHGENTNIYKSLGVNNKSRNKKLK